MSSRCDVTDLLVEQCAHCRPPVVDTARFQVTTVIESKFHGRCASCGDHYPEGTPIGHARGEGWIVIACCGTEQ